MAFPFYWMVLTTVRPEREAYSVTLKPLALADLSLATSTTSCWPTPSCRSCASSPTASWWRRKRPWPTSRARRSSPRSPSAATPFPAVRSIPHAIVATMMVPGEVVLIGLFRVVNALGLIDTHLGMILPLAVNAVNFLLVYNYMRALPRELDEAARVDGASAWQRLWHVWRRCRGRWSTERGPAGLPLRVAEPLPTPTSWRRRTRCTRWPSAPCSRRARSWPPSRRR